MKKTLNISENYGKRLKDELVPGSLRGEVEIQVKNKKTGEIESQQRHNLIVYGGREWLLKKVFNGSLNNVDYPDQLRNSEICWFGIGSGGGEPGNPLQCGCTYGSDKDLYNPVQFRNDVSSGLTSNPYYASRIMPNGDIVPGYYKKISYVAIKEDLANPYKENDIVKYPNLIAELRLEISSDDCCSLYLEKDAEKTYCDINEAALFAADWRVSDPGKDGSITTAKTEYLAYDEDSKRVNFEPKKGLPEHTTSNTKYEWTNELPFLSNYVQFYDVYEKKQGTSIDFDFKETIDGTTYYYKFGNKFNKNPVMLGIYSSECKCTGSITLSNNRLNLIFNTDEQSCIEAINLDGFTGTKLDDLIFSTHGTICIVVNKNPNLKGDTIKVNTYYRNGFNVDYTSLYPEYLFQQQTYRMYYPIGYITKSDNVIEEDPNFGLLSNIQVVQSTDVHTQIHIKSVVYDKNSTQVKLYVSDDDVKYINEGMKLYTYNEPESSIFRIPENYPATINEVYNAVQSTGTKDSEGSYIVIDRKIQIVESYEGLGLPAKVFNDTIDSPYKMFNRVTFSTIRVNSCREVILVWKIYF